MGDELTIRPDLYAGSGFRYFVLISMSALAGQTVRIKEILDRETVHIETEPESVGLYYWAPNMFLKPDAPQYKELELDLDALI